jgi:hypothetical protein
MNIYTVCDNLKNTIEGKEKYLSQITRELVAESDRAKIIALDATVKFLTININELKVILFDVEQCCQQYSLMSWEQNPDRSGGQFTQDEIYNDSRDGWIEP